MRPFIHAVALSGTLLACGSSGIPTIDPPSSSEADPGAGSGVANAATPAPNAEQTDPGAAASNADAGGAAATGDAAAPESRFDVSIDGTPQKVTQTRAVFMPAEHWLGVRAHVAASSTAPEGDIVVFFSNITAAGNVSCAQAQVMFQTTMGKRYSATGDASCQLTGVTIGPVGGTVDGSFSGTLRATKPTSAMNVTFSFSVVRAPDSELL